MTANKLKEANFKKIFAKYGSNIQAISIGTKSPIIKFQDLNLQKLWDEFSIKNNFTKIFQNLLSKMFTFGIYGIGFKKIDNSKIPKLILGEIINYEFDGFELNKLTIDLKQDLEQKNLKMAIYEEYDLSNQNAYIPKKIVDKSMLANDTLRIKKSKTVASEIPNRYEFIPFLIFANNWENKPDLFVELDFLFDALNNDFELLVRDGLISRSLIFQNEKVIKTDLKEIILNPKEVLIKASKLQSFLADPESGMIIKQGNPQAIILLQKIQQQIKLIEKFANLKISSSDLGTKNIHANEIENINSNFNDLIETKANLYEYQLLLFIELWHKFYQNHNLIINSKELNLADVDVTVFSSTKWLLNEAGKYVINQDGKKLNPNLKKLEENIEINNED